MNLADKETIKGLCRKYGLKPSKEAGQNFLVDDSVLQKIVEAADLKRDDVVLEVGPGFGVLTRELASRVKKVVAVELEKRVIKILRKNLEGVENVEIIQEDILKLISNFQFPIVKNITKVVANLPYGITSRFLRGMLERSVGEDTNRQQGMLEGDKTDRVDKTDKSNKTGQTPPNPPLSKGGKYGMPLTLLVQKEVAERVCAGPGKLSLLAVSVQFYAEPKIEFYVNKNSFWPEPEVMSAVISIRPRGKYLERLGFVGQETNKQHADKTDKSDKTDRSYKTDRTDKTDRSYKTDRTDKTDKSDKTDRTDKTDKTDKTDIINEFFRIARIGFSARRKQLQNNLAAGLRVDNEEVKKILREVGLREDIRAQDLSVENWIELVAKVERWPTLARRSFGG